MDISKAMRLNEDILALRKTELWKHLHEIGSSSQEQLVAELIRVGLESIDMRVRILSQHIVVSRRVWGEIDGIEKMVEEALAEDEPSEGTRSEFDYNAS